MVYMDLANDKPLWETGSKFLGSSRAPLPLSLAGGQLIYALKTVQAVDPAANHLHWKIEGLGRRVGHPKLGRAILTLSLFVRVPFRFWLLKVSDLLFLFSPDPLSNLLGPVSTARILQTAGMFLLGRGTASKVLQKSVEFLDLLPDNAKSKLEAW